MNHDVIAIGASAGGLEVLLDLVPRLPKDLPASIFIALHSAPGYPSSLPQLLSSRGPLPAKHPLHAESIQLGHIYVAPPDNHLLLRKGSMEVVRGPKENGHRPAADALFRTASLAYGPRVIGVVLSGYQDCGTVGMMSIKARGGIGVVQDPDSTVAPDMPRSVISRVKVDYVVAPRALADLLARLASEPVAQAAEPGELAEAAEGKWTGTRAELVCPACQGVLSEVASGTVEQFRCHVGHTFTLDGLARAQDEELDRALWAGVRALEEGAALSRRMSATSAGELRDRFAEKAATQAREAELIRQVLLHGPAFLDQRRSKE